MNLCTCCEENAVWSEAESHGHQLCEECSHTTDCDHPSHRAWSCEDAESHPIWEQGFCEKCRQRDRAESEKDELEQQVRALAAELEWQVADAHRADTGSVYLTLRRECDACILGTDDDCTCEEMTVRISDHGSCYCSEDVSLVIPSGNAGGDDHTIEYLRKRLTRRPPVEAN
jgi:hypothetical protein